MLVALASTTDAGMEISRGAAQRAETAKVNEYFICHFLVLTIDGKQEYLLLLLLHILLYNEALMHYCPVKWVGTLYRFCSLNHL